MMRGESKASGLDVGFRIWGQAGVEGLGFRV